MSEDTNPLIGRRFDAGIRVGALQDAAFVARPLGPLRMLTLASPAYLAAHGCPQSPDDLVHHQLLVAHFTDREQPTPFMLQSRATPDGPALPRMLPTTGTLAGCFVCSDYRGLLAACEAGLGIVLPVLLHRLGWEKPALARSPSTVATTSCRCWLRHWCCA